MKKKLFIIIEIITLLLIPFFYWLRNNGNLSTPFYQELTVTRLLLNIGITGVILFMLIQSIKNFQNRKSINPKFQILGIIIYFLLILPDLFIFLSWNFYTHSYYTFSIILISPLITKMIHFKNKTILTTNIF